MALGSQGTGFGILYAVVKGKWDYLPAFWYSTLRLWTDLHMDCGTTDWKAFSQTAPFWNNFNLLFGSTKRPLIKLSKNNVLLMDHGLCRQQDFVDISSSYATPGFLDTLLDVNDFSRSASKTLFIRQVIPRLNLLTCHDSPLYGPVFPPLIESARHGWSFVHQFVHDMTNKDFVRLLLKARTDSKTPNLPLRQLDIADFTPTDNMWNFEYGLDRHVIPIAADVKYRLQHNALGFRYKFRWRTEVTTSSTCIHSCSAIENAIHLFWLCPVASFQWDFYLLPFRDCLDGEIIWSQVLFPSSLRLLPDTL